MKRTISMSVFLFLILLGKAQGDKELLRSVFKNMSSQYTDQLPEHVCYMSYSLHTVHLDSLEKPTDVTIEVWKKNNLVEIKSDQMNVFQDMKETFIMLPDKHVIVRNDASLKDEIAVRKSMALYDSLLNYCEVFKSVREKSKNGYNRKISISINEKGQQLFKIKRADYFVDADSKNIKKVRVYYSDNVSATLKISYVDYMINELNYDYKGKELSEHVFTYFLTNDKLKNNYKD